MVFRKIVPNYSIGLMGGEVYEKHQSADFNSLRTEVAMIRTLIERTWNQCESPEELVANAEVISKLVERVEKVLVSCQKVELAGSTVLSESGVAKLLESLLDVVTEEVEDGDSLDRISVKLFDIASKYTRKD